MRVAIVHYWFLVSGGGERVVEALANMYPQADLFAMFADARSIPETLKGRKLTTSFLNTLPLARRINRQIFPLYPLAVESFDLNDYDLVISSDSPPVKGVLVNQAAVHVCYCHTPGRPLWDSYSEFRNKQSRVPRFIFSAGAQYVRTWDYYSAQRVDQFVANSKYVAQRIGKYYRRESTVIYPPVDTAKGYLCRRQDDYYLTVGRLVEGKRVDLLIEACNRMGRRLLIAGTGRVEKHLRSLAGPTIEFLGRVPDSQLPELYARARAFVFAADEDFGIAPVEAQAYGRPVICLGRGGSLETVQGYGLDTQPTGVFFGQQTVASICEAIQRFEGVEHVFQPADIRKHACQFDRAVFETRMRQVINGALQAENEMRSSSSGLAFGSDLAKLGLSIETVGSRQFVPANRNGDDNERST